MTSGANACPPICRSANGGIQADGSLRKVEPGGGHAHHQERAIVEEHGRPSTPASEPNRSVHSRCPSTTTWLAPSTSSSRVKGRPSANGIAKALKKPADTDAAGMRSACGSTPRLRPPGMKEPTPASAALSSTARATVMGPRAMEKGAPIDEHEPSGSG